MFKIEKPQKIITYESEDSSIIRFHLSKPIEIEGKTSIKKKLELICVYI